MANPKKLAEEAMAKAMLSAGKDAAKKAAFDLLSTDEERAAVEAEGEEKAAAVKKRRVKWIVLGVLGLCVVIGVLGLMMSYWHYFLAAGLLGLAAFYGRWRWRRSRAAKEKAEPSEDEPSKKERAKEEPSKKGQVQREERGEPKRALRIEQEAGEDDDKAVAEAEARSASASAAAQAREAGARAEAEAAEIEDELSALKARLKK
jgi:hypothetical protein